MLNMGTMTVNVDDEMEQKFRETVAKEKGVGKGKLGSAVQEAFDLWVQEKEQNIIAQRQLQLMEKGFRMGKYKFDREELHERQY